MIQKNYSLNSTWLKRVFLLACMLCLTGASAWSQTTLTVSGSIIPSSKIYDGTTAATVIPGTLVGVALTDTVNISAVYANYSSAEAGTDKQVYVTYALSGPQAGLYTVEPDTITGDILPLTIYVSGVQAESSKAYDGSTAFTVTDPGAIDANNVLSGDSVTYSVSANTTSPNYTSGFNTQLHLTFETAGPDSANYTISDTLDVLWGSITKRDLQIEYPTVQNAKEYDGNNVALVIDSATALNVVEGDSVVLTTTATYDDADTGINKTITVHFDLQGTKAHNYLVPADTLISGAIILPTVFDTTSGNAFNATVEGFCEGDSVKLAFDLISGYPVGYYMLFSDEAVAQGFPDSVWTACAPTDSVVAIPIPTNCAGGTYQVTVTFVNLAGVHSNAYTASFGINLSSKYLLQVFDDIISIDNSGTLDNQPDRFQTFQWYHNGQLIDETKPYHQEMGGLTGTYQVIVNAGTADENSICPWDESKYVVTAPHQVVHVNPSPVVSQAQVKLQGEFENETHLLRVYNSFGTEVLSTTFTGRAHTLNMSALPQGTYLINIDGVSAKTIKL